MERAMRGRPLLRIIGTGATATLLIASLAVAAPKKPTAKHTTKTFTLAAGATKTFDVGYPDALKFGNAKYSGKVEILKPTKVGKGQKAPDLKKVKVLSKGSAVGGSVYRAKVKNGNAKGTAPARVRITATTTH
jgi:hypothetical protein